MPTREVLSDAQKSRFTEIPELDTRELARHYTLSDADLASVSIRRGLANRLGFAVQLCLLRYPYQAYLCWILLALGSLRDYTG